jgi:hypothetical protein
MWRVPAREMGVVARASIAQGMRRVPALGMEAVHSRRGLPEGELYNMHSVLLSTDTTVIYNSPYLIQNKNHGNGH